MPAAMYDRPGAARLRDIADAHDAVEQGAIGKVLVDLPGAS
jgi:hypothetical protein